MISLEGMGLGVGIAGVPDGNRPEHVALGRFTSVLFCTAPDFGNEELLRRQIKTGAHGADSEFVKLGRLLLPFLCVFPS